MASVLEAVRPNLATGTAPGATPARPSAEALIQRARDLLPALKQRAQDTERARRVSADTTAMIREAELYKIMLPARWGGFEYGYAEFMDLIIEIGSGCASTGWCFGLANVHQWLGSLFPLQTQEEIWGEDPTALVCGSYPPTGEARAVPGGYMLRGDKWSFASNCDNSSWALLGVLFPADDENGGKPTPGFLAVPRHQYEIRDDWHVVGLAGTGSNTIVIRDEIFVPRHRMLTFPQASSGQSPGTAVHPNPLYKMPFLAAVPISICSPGLGALQGAINDFTEMASVRVSRGAVTGGGSKLAELQSIQIRLAEAEACLDAAKLLFRRDIEDVQNSVARGETITVDQRIRNRRDHAFAIKLARQGIDALYEAVGGHYLQLNTSIQRHWRDVHAVSKHISMNWDWVGSMVGQYRLGLEPKGQY
jgi:alkylation response protein AidB-like acyl-CoA dehydrogenase